MTHQPKPRQAPTTTANNPTSVCFTGFAFSFNLANAIFGGTAAFAAIALVAMIFSHENTDKDLDRI